MTQDEKRTTNIEICYHSKNCSFEKETNDDDKEDRMNEETENEVRLKKEEEKKARDMMNPYYFSI